MRRNRVRVGLLLAALVAMMACADSNCGGCVGQLPEPFPNLPRVYDGVQLRLTQSAISFVQQNLPQILDTLLEGGLNFELPPSEFDVSMFGIGVQGTVCPQPCSIQAQILDAQLTPITPDKVAFSGHVNVDGTIVIDAGSILGTCDVPLHLQNKPIASEITLLIDNDTAFLHFDIGDVQLEIVSDDYELQCPGWYNWLLDWLKDTITAILNNRLQSELNGAIDDLVAAQTCLPCDFYGSGCPNGSSCNGDGWCIRGNGSCAIKPLGLVGRLDLGAMLADVAPGNDAQADLLITPGQAQQPAQRPIVRANGLEVRIIGGTSAEADACIPEPDPSDVPQPGVAPAMPFGNLIPGVGDPYMVAVAVADKYLDHFLYHVWRSGFLCLTLDTYSMDLISSGTLGLILDSINLLTEGTNSPMRLEMQPRGVPKIEIGAGTFLPDGSVDEPILYVFLPEVRLDFWLKLQGRWVLLLSLLQDLQIDLALEFTTENTVVPLVDTESIHVTGVQVSHHELLAEPVEDLEALVPNLVELALPQLLGSLEAIAIPDLQGFKLDIRSVQGDVDRSGTPYHEFMTIYADLAFAAPPPPAGRALAPAGPSPGPTLDETGESAPLPTVGCATSAGGSPSLGGWLLALVWLWRRRSPLAGR